MKLTGPWHVRVTPWMESPFMAARVCAIFVWAENGCVQKEAAISDMEDAELRGRISTLEEVRLHEAWLRVFVELEKHL